jgi:hypothetical protein
MSTDGKLPVEQRRGYKNAFNAIFRIAKEEGVTALWKVNSNEFLSVHYFYFQN